MVPAEQNITIYRGDSFSLTLRLRQRNADGTAGTYLDLTGVVARAQIRATEDAPDVLATFVTTVLDQVATPGGVSLTLATADTAVLPANMPSKWDVELDFPNGDVKTYLKGTVSVVADVTK